MVSATKKTGRPPTGIGTPVQVRLNENQLSALDEWRRKQADLPGRPEAMRQLMELGLAAPKAKGKR